jgi:hypothetical protein
MSSAAPTFEQIRAWVAALRKKVVDARAIGISSPGRWTGQGFRQSGDERYVIVQCDSPLAMRLALRDLPENATTVLITSLDDSELDEDIRVRLAKRKLFALDNWQIVKSLFDARSIDPRVTWYPWLAEELLTQAPDEGYAPTAGGFLDAERVWGIVLKAKYGFPSSRPDLPAVLMWSVDAANVATWRDAPEEHRATALEWLTQTGGPVVAAVLRCVLHNQKPDAVPVGLASRVVFGVEAKGKLEKAIGRMEERFLGGQASGNDVLERWCQACLDLVNDGIHEPMLKRTLLARSDKILHEVGAEAFAYLSDASPLGFDQRFERFGRQFLETLKSDKVESVDAIRGAQDAVCQHRHAQTESRRVDRMQMAVRLVRWLERMEESPRPQPASLAEAAQQHLAEGGFVDWARLSLRAGDSVQTVSQAYRQLFDKVTVVREGQAKRFAELLGDWVAAGAAQAGIIGVERILDEIVVPLAAKVPVLLVVIDGMSAAVWRELLADLTRHEWTALVPDSGEAIPPVIATLPSVTEISRTSLLCGRLMRGTASDESKGFEGHPGLVAQSRADRPPLLFHKAAVQESDEVVLDNDVRRQIASSQRRIVGVVINAVDDHLLKGEQIDVQWSRDEIRALPALLHEARVAGRVVILVSDHGHVLDHGTDGRTHEDAGERWRPDDGTPTEGELVIAGDRVLAPDGKAIIAVWTESVRYGMKKNGYHGGLSPQEMVVPVSVLSAGTEWSAGWREAPVAYPGWWEEDFGELPPLEAAPAVREPEKPSGLLFPVEEPEPETTKAGAVARQIPAWIMNLLASPLFAEQKELGGRAAPSDEVFTQLLSALDERGGKMTTTALARALGRPPHRLAGLLAVAQRVLNVDGYAVLSRDDASESVELNTDLLRRQFGLE